MNSFGSGDKKSSFGFGAGQKTPTFGSNSKSGGFTFGAATSFGGAKSGGGFGTAAADGPGIGAGGGNNIFGKPAQAAFGTTKKEDGVSKVADVGAGDDDHVDTSALKLPELHGKLKEVEVKSGEEDEDVLITVRSKLYVFYETDKYGDEVRKNLWKSRGTGDVKLLKHRDTGKVRLLMRQDKVKKICANVLLPKDATLKPQEGTKTSMVTSLPDFDGDTTEVRTMAFKFKDEDIAGSFAKAFAEAVLSNAGVEGTTTDDKSASTPPKSNTDVKPSSPAATMSKMTLSASEDPSPAPAPPTQPSNSAADPTPIPVVSSLGEIYGENNPNLAKSRLRYKNLCARFRAVYGTNPSFIVRAPGRVNIIGEHIDYMGYSVMPFALENDTLIAGLTVQGGSTVELNHVDDQQFPPVTFPANNELQVDVSKGVQWYNYFQCGYRGLFDETAAQSGSQRARAEGLKLLVHTTVPLGSGLSSSSSFVVCSLLATAKGHAVTLNQKDVGERAQKCEGYIGTMGGGMDQAISVMGERGMAKHVEFNPLRTSDVSLPEGGCFVVANSLAKSAKAVSADKQYNLRVTECKLGVLIVAKEAGLTFASGENVTYRALAEKYFKLPDANISIDQLQQMEQFCRDKLHEAAYTQAEIEKKLSGSCRLILNDRRCDNVFNVNKEFFLHQRAKHVYSEACRVLAFKEECAKASYPGQLAALGKLMDDSGASCAGDYDCSCPELDALTNLARKSGALGSRLTGAGWGGSTVSLVKIDQVDQFVRALQKGYFDQNPEAKGMGSQQSYLFASSPAQGAVLVEIGEFLTIDDVNIEDLI